MPIAAADAALAVAAPAELIGQSRCELRLPLPDGFVAEDDAAEEEHLNQVP